MTRADFKSCVSFTDPYANDVKLNLLTVVMGVPKLIFSRICHTSELIFYTSQILIDFQTFWSFICKTGRSLNSIQSLPHLKK